jgi:multiple sugar transport system permease protein
MNRAAHALAAAAVHGWMIVLCLLTLFPLVWLLIMATHERSEIFSIPPPMSLGNSLAANYAKLLDLLPFWLALWNSLSVAVLGATATMFLCAACAYGLTAFSFRGQNVVFGIIVASMMVPAVVTLVPFFLVIRSIGLLDTHMALWLPGAASGFGIFLLRQHMVATISRELREAAQMDGANHWWIFWFIALPMSRPALATVGLVHFVTLWNSFLAPLIVLSSPDKYVLTLALRSVQSLGNTEWGALMLGVALSILPLVIAFLFFSRQMIAGLTAGAVKG